jgi:replicative DNA helicase
MFELVEELQKEPDAVPPMYGEVINESTRGMRYGRLYIRSAASGVGKTRTMVADACNCACSKIFDTKKQEWVDNGLSFPSLYIATEQELDEIQTIALAFLSGVDEEHILTGQYNFGNEKERVLQAAKILQESPLYIEYIPDFTLRDIENCIKRHLRQNGVQFVFYDYVHTSMKMLEEISRRSGGIRLREDNLLFLLSVKLKDLCTQFGIFILTSTQLNQD